MDDLCRGAKSHHHYHITSHTFKNYLLEMHILQVVSHTCCLDTRVDARCATSNPCLHRCYYIKVEIQLKC